MNEKEIHDAIELAKEVAADGEPQYIWTEVELARALLDLHGKLERLNAEKNTLQAYSGAMNGMCGDTLAENVQLRTELDTILSKK